MGGLPRAVAALAAAQACTGNTVSLLFCGEPPEGSTLERWMGGAEPKEKVRMITLPSIRTLGRSKTLEPVLEELQPEWIQTHGLWEPVLHAAMRWALRNRIPYGITPHSMQHPWQQENRRWRKALLRKGLGVERLWMQAHLIHALTQAEDRDWRPLCGDRVQVIPNGVGEPVPGPGQVELPGGPYLLFLSRLHVQKSPEVLLRAFLLLSARMPKVELVLAGPDYGAQRGLETLIRQRGLHDRVHLAGTLSGADKWEALRRCAAFCLPSQGEGLSLALLEACAVGAPCLITEECGFPELIEAGGALLVDRNPASLAHRIQHLLEHPEEAEELGRQAQKLIREQYTWPQVAAAFDAVLAEAAA